MTKIVLYHGSNVPVLYPMLRKQNRHDFGNGFYLTTDYIQAKNWAKRKANYSSSFYVNCYTIDKTNIHYLKYLRFKQPSKDWLNLVILCRKDNYEPKFDLISGPVMDGHHSWIVLDLYRKNKLSFKETIKELEIYNLTDQFVFKTKKSLSYLRLLGVLKNGKKIY